MPAHPKTHYDTLGIATGASRAEIDRAYLARKTSGSLESKALWDLERAYVTLADPELRRTYDAELHPASAAARPGHAAPSSPTRSAPQPRGRRLALPVDRPWMLPLLGALLGVLLWVNVWPRVAWRFRLDPTGTSLVIRDGARPLGVVTGFEARHDFGGGIRLDAYRIRLPSSEEKWFTRAEINQLTRHERP